MARLPQRRRYQGTIRPGGPDWVYLPVEVPGGVGELAVRYHYDRPPTPPGVPGNVLDIGVFDERGAGPEEPPAGPAMAGFRGWSGGARDQFAISRSAATPGYLPGPIGPGPGGLCSAPTPSPPRACAGRSR